MRIFKKILPFFFLCVYSCVLIHSLIPHFHSDLHSDQHSHSHSHEIELTDHNHHHSESNNSESILDLFSGLLGDHEHQESNENHLEEFVSQCQNNFGFNFNTLVAAKPLLSFSFATNIIVQVDDDIDHPPILYEQFLCSSDPLRGPPNLI